MSPPRQRRIDYSFFVVLFLWNLFFINIHSLRFDSPFFSIQYLMQLLHEYQIAYICIQLHLFEILECALTLCDSLCPATICMLLADVIIVTAAIAVPAVIVAAAAQLYYCYFLFAIAKFKERIQFS